MSDLIKCEVCGTTEDVDFYKWPVQEEGMPAGIEACPEHAMDNGFCPMCGFFVLGSPEERGLQKNGCCSECFDEFHSDWDDSDFSGEEWIFYS